MDDHVETPSLKPPLHNSAQPRDKEPDDIKKLREWQQQRLERRLRGDYESAVLHLSQVINNNLDSPARIAAIRVEGAHRTRRSFLSFLFSPFLVPDPDRPTDLQSTLHTARHISHLLRKTDIFSNVALTVDQARDPGADSNDVDLVFTTRERGRLYLNSSTELGNNEGSASATGRIRNVFGGAETFEANIAFGTKTRRSFRASLSAPVSHDLNTTAEITTYGLDRDLTSYASCFEGLRGVKAVIRSGYPQWGMHEFSYEGVIRHLASLTPTASLSIREAAGFSSKSSLSHTFTIDTRHDKILGTRFDRITSLASAPGMYLKVHNELAGLGLLGGDAKFYKGEVEAKAGFGMAEGLSLSLAARSGLLWGLGGSRGTLFSDRFQVGGPISVRGFMNNGLGPHDGSDSLGGDAYWSLGASVISDIPKRPSWPVKLHAWVNTGRLEGIDRARPPKESIRALQSSLFQRPSVSAGLGLIYKFDPIRVEVNFGLPLVSSAGERGKRGVQVGMGLEFL